MLSNQFTYGSNAVVRIGNDILVFVNNGSYLINGALGFELTSILGELKVSKEVDQK